MHHGGASWLLYQVDGCAQWQLCRATGFEEAGKKKKTRLDKYYNMNEKVLSSLFVGEKNVTLLLPMGGRGVTP